MQAKKPNHDICSKIVKIWTALPTTRSTQRTDWKPTLLKNGHNASTQEGKLCLNTFDSYINTLYMSQNYTYDKKISILCIQCCLYHNETFHWRVLPTALNFISKHYKKNLVEREDTRNFQKWKFALELCRHHSSIQFC